MGIATYISPMQYDSGDGLHVDIHYDGGIGVTHTIRSATVTCSKTSKSRRLFVKLANGTEFLTPRIPLGRNLSLSRQQLNQAGLVVLEDIDYITASP